MSQFKKVSDNNNRITRSLIGSIIKVDKKYKFLGNDLIVGVSGGIDSLSLFTVLKNYYLKKYPNKKVIGVHVSISGEKFTNLDIKGVENIRVDKKIVFPIDCYQCSRIRREYIFKFADKIGIRDILFAHHKDDFVERFLWNMFYYKKLESLPICRSFFNERFRILRPFAFVKKKDIEKYALQCDIKDIEYKCNVNNKVTELIKKVEKIFWDIDLVENLYDVIEKNEIYGEKYE